MLCSTIMLLEARTGGTFDTANLAGEIARLLWYGRLLLWIHCKTATLIRVLVTMAHRKTCTHLRKHTSRGLDLPLVESLLIHVSHRSRLRTAYVSGVVLFCLTQYKSRCLDHCYIQTQGLFYCLNGLLFTPPNVLVSEISFACEFR